VRQFCVNCGAYLDGVEVRAHIEVDLGPAADLRLHPDLRVLGVELDARLGLLERGGHLKEDTRGRLGAAALRTAAEA